MTKRMVIRGAVSALLGVVLGSALFVAAQAAPLFDIRIGGATFALDLPRAMSPGPRLSKVVAVSGNAPVAPVKRLLIPGLSDGRWRFAFSLSGLLGYSPYRASTGRVDPGEIDGFTALSGQGGGSIVAAYRTPDGTFGFALRVHANGAVRIAFDHPERDDPRPGTGLLPVSGITYTPTPVPLPPSLFMTLGALAPIALMASRRRRRSGP